MCSYVTVQIPMQGSAKGPNGTWFTVTDAAVARARRSDPRGTGRSRRDGSLGSVR